MLVLVPGNVTTLNRLGYFLSINPAQFDEAEQLLRRSLALEPEHGYASSYLGAMLSALPGPHGCSFPPIVPLRTAPRRGEARSPPPHCG